MTSGACLALLFAVGAMPLGAVQVKMSAKQFRRNPGINVQHLQQIPNSSVTRTLQHFRSPFCRRRDPSLLAQQAVFRNRLFTMVQVGTSARHARKLPVRNVRGRSTLRCWAHASRSAQSIDPDDMPVDDAALRAELTSLKARFSSPTPAQRKVLEMGLKINDKQQEVRLLTLYLDDHISAYAYRSRDTLNGCVPAMFTGRPALAAAPICGASATSLHDECAALR